MAPAWPRADWSPRVGVEIVELLPRRRGPVAAPPPKKAGVSIFLPCMQNCNTQAQTAVTGGPVRVVQTANGCDRADGNGTWQSFMVAPEANLEAVPDGISDQDGAQFAVRHATTHAHI